MFRAAKTEPDALAHIPDEVVVRAVRDAEKAVTRASAVAFVAASGGTSRRRAMTRMRLNTACEARDTWVRVAVARGLLPSGLRLVPAATEAA